MQDGYTGNVSPRTQRAVSFALALVLAGFPVAVSVCAAVCAPGDPSSRAAQAMMIEAGGHQHHHESMPAPGGTESAALEGSTLAPAAHDHSAPPPAPSMTAPGPGNLAIANRECCPDSHDLFSESSAAGRAGVTMPAVPISSLRTATHRSTVVPLRGEFRTSRPVVPSSASAPLVLRV